MSAETLQPSIDMHGGWRERWLMRTGAITLAGVIAVGGFKLAGEIFNSSEVTRVQCKGANGGPDGSTHSGNIEMDRPLTFQLFDREANLDAEVLVRRDATGPAIFALGSVVTGVEQQPAQYGNGIVVTSGTAEWTITVSAAGSYMAFGDC